MVGPAGPSGKLGAPQVPDPPPDAGGASTGQVVENHRVSGTSTGLQLALDPALLNLGPMPRAWVPLPISAFSLTLRAPEPQATRRPLSLTMRVFSNLPTFALSDAQGAPPTAVGLPFSAALSSQFEQFHFRGTSFEGFGVGAAFGWYGGRFGVGVMAGIPGLGSGILSIKLSEGER